jgi:hypothetical protein
MNRKINIVTETLKDLNMDKVNQLYDKLIATYFVPKETVDWNIMYLFPDGRMLGSKVEPAKTKRGRGTRTSYHTAIYQTDYYDVEDAPLEKFIERTFEKKNRLEADPSLDNFEKDDRHPASNPILAKYYNLIIVVPLDEDGGIIIPDGVEPTEEQTNRIEELLAFGYKMLSKKNWRLHSGRW